MIIALVLVCFVAALGCEKKGQKGKKKAKADKEWSLSSVFGCAKKPAKVRSVKELPNFTLLDPAGIAHSRDQLLKGGLVIVVTAPTLSQEKSQKGWSELLAAHKPKGASLVFLEDMSASSFKGMAKKEMKKEYKPGDPVILLLDEAGNLRGSLGVEKGKTAVLVYDKDGGHVYTDTGKPSTTGAQKIWGKLK